MLKYCLLLATVALSLSLARSGSAQVVSDEAVAAPDAGAAAPSKTAPPPTRTKLIVSTKPTPPFAIKNADGTWTGMSIELWRQIAEELEIDYELRETTFAEMLAGLEDGSLDAGVAAITVTPAREAAFDFTHPFFSTGLGIAVSAESEGILSTLSALLSWKFLRAMGLLVLVLFAVGAIIWLFERRRNPEQFGGGAAKGIGAGFWWSAVTVTTVGYGDKAPVTLGGRIVGLIWMFISVVTISSFTATIASALTVQSLASAVHGPEDLPNVRVGSIRGTTSGAYLEREGINYRPFDSVPDGLLAVARGEIDAMVYDKPIMQFYVNSREELRDRVTVLPGVFERQDYGIGLRAGMEEREEINRVLLAKIGSQWWIDLNRRYLGR